MKSGYNIKLCKNATHLEVELCGKATNERVREIIRPLIEFSRYMDSERKYIALVVTANRDSHSRSNLTLNSQNAMCQHQSAQQFQSCYSLFGICILESPGISSSLVSESPTAIRQCRPHPNPKRWHHCIPTSGTWVGRGRAAHKEW